jgi:hypothetical protein
VDLGALLLAPALHRDWVSLTLFLPMVLNESDSRQLCKYIVSDSARLLLANSGRLESEELGCSGNSALAGPALEQHTDEYNIYYAW